MTPLTAPFQRGLVDARRPCFHSDRPPAYRGGALSFVHVSEEAFAENRPSLVPSVKEDGIDLYRKAVNDEIDRYGHRGQRSEDSSPRGFGRRY